MRQFMMLLLLFSGCIIANVRSEAHITGDTYLGIIGSSISLELEQVICTLSSSGNESTQEFSIHFSCGDLAQLIWYEGLSNFGIDEPRFELLWAGDMDGDGKLDLKMETSPKYSCMQQTLYLSSLAPDGLLLGIDEQSELKCH
uniref:hypothetical protein n=1 Tax=Thaumasiovibrio occultus TaxID=1891184 RepID=UPI000B34F9F9|nr:hypothetical protein [Thaumasiovibrio occultus]